MLAGTAPKRELANAALKEVEHEKKKLGQDAKQMISSSEDNDRLLKTGQST